MYIYIYIYCCQAESILTGEFSPEFSGCKYHPFYVVFPSVAVLWEFRTDKLCPINKADLKALLSHLFGIVKFTFQPLAGFNDGEGSPHSAISGTLLYDCTLSAVSTDQSANEGSKVKAFSRTKGQFTSNSIFHSFSTPVFHSSILNLSSSTHLSTVFIYIWLRWLP